MMTRENTESAKHQPKKLLKIILAVAVLGCLLTIAYFSHQPFAQQDLRPRLERHKRVMMAVRMLPAVRFSYDGQVVDNRRDPAGFVQFWLRKGMHVVLYGVFGLLAAGFYGSSGLKGPGCWLRAGLLVAGVALLDEWHQRSVAGRTGRLADVGLDVAGYGGLAMLYLTCRAVGQAVRKKH